MQRKETAADESVPSPMSWKGSSGVVGGGWVRSSSTLPMPAPDHGPTRIRGASHSILSPWEPHLVSQSGHSRSSCTPQGRQQAHRSNMARVVPASHEPPLVGGIAPKIFRAPFVEPRQALGTSSWPPGCRAGGTGGHPGHPPGSSSVPAFLPYRCGCSSSSCCSCRRSRHLQGHTRRRGPPKAGQHLVGVGSSSLWVRSCTSLWPSEGRAW